MEFKKFQETIGKKVLSYLPEEYANAEVKMEKVEKNNGVVLTSLMIRLKDDFIVPNIYLDAYYSDYKMGHKTMEDILAEITKFYLTNKNVSSDCRNIREMISDFESLKDLIVMVLVNTEKNAEFLKTVPHIETEDLSIIFRVMLPTDDDTVKTFTIRNEFMDMWNVDTDTIYELAKVNTPNLLPANIDNFMGMQLITNTQCIFGASVILYDGVLEKLAKKIGGNVYIIPSSVHECLAISADFIDDEELSKMIQDVNREAVREDEFLSDHAYIYDAKKKTFTSAK